MPTIYEVVNGKNKVRTSGTNNHSSTKSKPNSKVRAAETPTNKNIKAVPHPKEEEDDDEAPEEEADEAGENENGEEEEHGETLCGACGDNYGADEFWICCDVCEKWFHGKCVKITPARAEHIKQYKCPSCSTSNKRARPS